MDVKMWMLSFKDLALQKQIGEGSFGRVSHRVCHRAGDTIYVGAVFHCLAEANVGWASTAG